MLQNIFGDDPILQQESLFCLAPDCRGIFSKFLLPIRFNDTQYCKNLLNLSALILLETLETVNVSQDSQSFQPFRKPNTWFSGNLVPSF